MSQQDSNTLNKSYDNNAIQDRSIVEELADAKKEINDLKMQIMWMERQYE
ncbi:hypothetical protein SAMN05216361_2047 [Marisediminitalea aggregata]|jgi:hypothetical protein|uniref:Uncharacterized protein n=1 Tax=Marisediminitalea aggregata TaxID=634436 RepID=A0A1M5JDP6_9ALTE|nr:hypothetical protein [Marisediminitalea aggregata]MEC7825463.1 hypothetical protein [Pseudomonadota bacterium]SHG38631.1 hypothetical protein SAMN05216361_2047 [Marisediminitalea aggregata]|tara:strand:- start:3719 stop:3868 length:150 start_codon:yes stop_codon:yes gene_type:complete